MSGPAIAWAIEQGCSHRLTPALRLLLQYLGDQADDSHECKPGQERIRKYTGLSLNTIRTGAQRLVRRGLITIEEYAGMATQYRLNIAMNGEDPATEPPQTVTGYPLKPLQGAPSIGGGVTPANGYRVPGQTPSNGAGDRARAPAYTLPSLKKEEREVVLPVEGRGEGVQGERGGCAPDPEPKTPKRAYQLPDGWVPNEYSFSLGHELGLTDDEIRFEADAMRDWALDKRQTGTQWDRRFNNWLRNEAKRRRLHGIRHRPQRTLEEEWGLGSLLTPVFDDDDLPPSERPGAPRLQ